MTSSTYTYTIFDADPQSTGGAAWPSHQEREIEADSDEDALFQVREIMSVEANGLERSDGYDVGQRLYALVWQGARAEGVIVGQPTYTLTALDLGLDVHDDDFDV